MYALGLPEASKKLSAAKPRSNRVTEKVSERKHHHPGQDSKTLRHVPRRCSATKWNIQASATVCLAWPGQQHVRTCGMESLPAVS